MILFPDDIGEEQINKIGGKALNLLKLTIMGFAVPEWFVIPGDILDEFFKRNQKRIRKILECNLSIREKSKALKRLVKKDSNLREKLEPLCEKISAMAPVSIRSSGIMEDVEEYSFAGQFSSFLNVKNGFVKKILDCLASLFNTQNIHYHQAHDINILKNRVAVIVQRMVEAEKSGVVFTAHPETGEPMMIVNVGYGLGEGVVSEKADVDTFILSPEGKTKNTARTSMSNNWPAKFILSGIPDLRYLKNFIPIRSTTKYPMITGNTNKSLYLEITIEESAEKRATIVR